MFSLFSSASVSPPLEWNDEELSRKDLEELMNDRTSFSMVQTTQTDGVGADDRTHLTQTQTLDLPAEAHSLLKLRLSDHKNGHILYVLLIDRGGITRSWEIDLPKTSPGSSVRGKLVRKLLVLKYRKEVVKSLDELQQKSTWSEVWVFMSNTFPPQKPSLGRKPRYQIHFEGPGVIRSLLN